MKHRYDFIPYLVYSDGKGNIFEDQQYFAAGRSGTHHILINAENLIELPKGSDIFELPDRNPYAFNRYGELEVLKDKTAVAAFIAPGHTQLLLSSYKKKEGAQVLPLFAYTAIGWYKGKFYVPAIRIDPDKRQEPHFFDQNKINLLGKRLLKEFPKNRLLEHIVKDCAFTYFCPAARNFVLGRYEAPLPSSPYCNSRCLGCLSFQDKSISPISCTQPRINFVPSVSEIVEVALLHIERAKKAIVSFGQGCEGEPLLVGDVICEAIKWIRKKTSKGVINLNTNGSIPKMVDRLFASGLDSIRVSMNSAKPEIYTKYYQPKNYNFTDVLETLRIGRKHNKWVSINYFVFPGLTDEEEEFKCFCEMIKDSTPNMIQWRNFNIDPDWYLEFLDVKNTSVGMGVFNLMKKIKKSFPFLRFGYYNPWIGKL